METDSVLVSVLCTAYNHEKWIKDAIEGVLKQKVNFKYEFIVHDDASTDHTASIIKQYAKKYPDIIHPIFQKENQFSECNIYKKYLFPSARGKYIAFCEGDDYWCHSQKLQMQVDFMELHPDYSMCMHNAIKLDCITGKETCLNSFEKEGTYSQEEHLLCGMGSDYPAFASYFIRSECLRVCLNFLQSRKFWIIHCDSILQIKEKYTILIKLCPSIELPFRVHICQIRKIRHFTIFTP